MSAPIQRTFWLFTLLFLVLIGFTSQWAVFDAPSLRSNPHNRRALLEEQGIKRGKIKANDGSTIAYSVAQSKDRYTRRYPQGSLFAHPVGYSFTTLGRAELELSENGTLTGQSNGFKSIWEEIVGKEPIGNDVVTTLSPAAQRAAFNALAGRKGSVVALDVKTGAIRVFVSNPSYNPNRAGDPKNFRKLSTDSKNAPLVDRAISALYTPGSVFKVVTATAALSSGKFTPTTVVNGNNNKIISGVPLRNYGGINWGNVTLTEALTNSVNTVWAQVGGSVGGQKIAKYAKGFGFYSRPQTELPRNLQVSSAVIKSNGKRLPLTSNQVDIGRVAIGHGDLFVTPLQMAIVAQTIGNRGRRMRPYFIDRTIDPDGRVMSRTKPKQVAKVMSNKVASQLTQMMLNVVKEGTGTAAALSGVTVAGKTGTAELDSQGKYNNLWFICFTNKYALAVVIEHALGGQGGTVAAPIAPPVLKALGE